MLLSKLHIEPGLVWYSLHFKMTIPGPSYGPGEECAKIWNIFHYFKYRSKIFFMFWTRKSYMFLKQKNQSTE